MFEKPDYVTCYCWGRKDAAENNMPFSMENIKTNGAVQADEQSIRVDFNGEAGDFILTFSLNRNVLANSYGARFRLDRWKRIKYIAIGYTENNVFWHVKINNMRLGHWLDFFVSHHDLAFLLQNKWSKEGAKQISDLRFFIKGEPAEGASISVGSFYVGLKKERSCDSLLEKFSVNQELSGALVGYWKDCYSKWPELIEKYENFGELPIYGDRALAWNVFYKKPEQLAEINSYRFSWHALHAVSMLLVAGRTNKKIANFFSARELVTQWLDNSFFTIDEDQKYTWYDHGVAERTLVFIELLQIGNQQQFDYRFMSRLGYALVKHAELLQSETFYALHQPYRYHNHAWFQDIALIASGICLQHLNVANNWIETGLDRLHDQLQQLIHREAGYAVFVENSIGYHQGVQRLIGFAGELETLAGKGTGITAIAQELDAWTQLLTYPDRRIPAQGDTFRKPNPTQPAEKILPENWRAGATILPQAGYAILKGGTVKAPWLFGLLATNLNDTHKHEDDLSFFLWFDGVEWFTDPSFMSHEYKDLVPAYLRSAKAHNMVTIEGVPYRTTPAQQRVVIENTSPASKTKTAKKLHISGYNRSCLGYEIQRHIECHDKEGLPVINCTDSFYAQPEAFVPAGHGLLSFHFGDGVQAAWQQHQQELRVELTHPASRHTLLLTIQCPDEQNPLVATLEDSVCGLGFMQQTATQALRLSLQPAAQYRWTLTYKILRVNRHAVPADRKV